MWLISLLHRVEGFVESRLTRKNATQSGATMIEYILMVVLIAVAAIVAMKLLGTNLSAKFNYIATCISTPASC